MINLPGAMKKIARLESVNGVLSTALRNIANFHQSPTPSFAVKDESAQEMYTQFQAYFRDYQKFVVDTALKAIAKATKEE